LEKCGGVGGGAGGSGRAENAGYVVNRFVCPQFQTILADTSLNTLYNKGLFQFARRFEKSTIGVTKW